MGLSRAPNYGFNVVAMLSEGVENRQVRDAWHRMMIGYQPIGGRGLKNFFRMVLHGTPRPTREDMHFVVEEIERIGEQIDIDA